MPLTQLDPSLAENTARRFAGLERLYGPEGLLRLGQARIAVAGIGGVGSWCAEALARSGVGSLVLIDMDHLSESNVNRQLHALTHTLGQSKVAAMGERILGINPACRLELIDDFVEPSNVGQMLDGDLTLVIDCTDQASAKVAMILEARRRHMPIVVCGGAGGKTNLLSLRAGDMSQAVNDALLAKLRNTLRRQHGFPKASAQGGTPRKRVPKMGVRALWFDQQAILPAQWAIQANAQSDADTESLQGLSCAGYGSAVAITAGMGMAAANEAMQWVLGGGRWPS